jgi:methylated-DNA-protein-cysteine methyltransferase-like protein
MPPRRQAQRPPRATAGRAGSGDPAAADPRLVRVWAVVAAIRRGSVATYGGVAHAAGLPRRARFVAHALKTAPRALGLPWHRVVAAGGRIALPPGSSAHREQCRRLAAEGVVVERGRVRLPDAGSLDALLWGDGRC